MAGEVAEAIAAIATNLPAKTKQTLEFLLARDLAEQQVRDSTPAARLGFLLELLILREGEFPTVENYETQRSSEESSWPSASQLIRSYGSWVATVRAAASLGFAGPTLQKKSSYPSHPYSREEAVHSLLQFRRDLGAWPTSASEYSAWAELTRSIQLRWGRTQDRIVTGFVLRTKLGPLERAIRTGEKRVAQA